MQEVKKCPDTTIRKKVGFSQEALGKLIGVDKNTIWRWENEKSQPRASAFKKLAEVLGTTEAELLNGPAKRQLEIIIDLEGVEEMDTETIKSNSVFCGYRGSDDSLLFRGAVPVGDASDEDIIETTLNAMRTQLEAAFATRARLRKA
jgi:transcriptional regulator with XRE-family HTH domain